jgi:hypothetical protein
MSGAPAVRPAITNAAGLIPNGQQRTPESKRYVTVINPFLDGNRMRRKDAEYYVKQDRAVWLDEAKSQLRLVMSHPANQAVLERAAAEWEALIKPDPSANELAHAIACFPQKFRRIEHRDSYFLAPRKPVVHVPVSNRVPDSLCRPEKPKGRSLRDTTAGARVAADLLFKWPLTKSDVNAMKDAVS